MVCPVISLLDHTRVGTRECSLLVPFHLWVTLIGWFHPFMSKLCGIIQSFCVEANYRVPPGLLFVFWGTGLTWLFYFSFVAHVFLEVFVFEDFCLFLGHSLFPLVLQCWWSLPLFTLFWVQGLLHCPCAQERVCFNAIWPFSLPKCFTPGPCWGPLRGVTLPLPAGRFWNLLRVPRRCCELQRGCVLTAV